MAVTASRQHAQQDNVDQSYDIQNDKAFGIRNYPQLYIHLFTNMYEQDSAHYLSDIPKHIFKLLRKPIIFIHTPGRERVKFYGQKNFLYSVMKHKKAYV